MSTISTTVELDVDDILCSIKDEDLEPHGLSRMPESDVQHHHAALFQAVESGDVQSIIRAAENIAWGMYGKILVPKGVM